MGFKADMDAKKFDQARFGDWAKWDKNADGKLDRSGFNAGMYFSRADATRLSLSV
jgi:hypothetical protein